MFNKETFKIAKKIKGRTGDMVKNRFYSSLKNHLDEFDEEEKEIKKKKNLFQTLKLKKLRLLKVLIN